MSNNTIGQRIKSRRKELKMTQAQLGAALNPPVKTSTISGYETGYSSPDIDTIIGIASALNCTVEDLIFSEITPERLMYENAVQHIANKIPPLYMKREKIREDRAFREFLAEIGYLCSYDYDDAEKIEYIADKDGNTGVAIKPKYVKIKSLRSSKNYKITTEDFDDLRNRIMNYAKFEITQRLPDEIK